MYKQQYQQRSNFLMNAALSSPKYTETNFIWEKNYSFPEITSQSAQFALEKSPRREVLLQSHFKPTISQAFANNLLQASHTTAWRHQWKQGVITCL